MRAKKRTKNQIASELKKLRRIVEKSPCPIQRKLAYSAECAIRWATEATAGWAGPAKDSAGDAFLLRKEIKISG